MKKKVYCIEKHCRKEAKRGGRCYGHDKRIWRLANPEHDCYLNLKASAKRRNIFFDLTLEEFKKFCSKSILLQGRGRTKECYSVDRIIEEKGYTAGNLQVLTISANSKKEHERRKREKLLVYDWQTKEGRVKTLKFSEPDPDCPF